MWAASKTASPTTGSVGDGEFSYTSKGDKGMRSAARGIANSLGAAIVGWRAASGIEGYTMFLYKSLSLGTWYVEIPIKYS